MKDKARAVIAGIAGRLLSGQFASAVWDSSRSKMVQFSGEVSRERVHVYDHDQGCTISGSGSHGKLSLYHQGDGGYIQLELHRNGFTGYDHVTGSYFHGSLNRGLIVLYDLSESAYFHYRI